MRPNAFLALALAVAAAALLGGRCGGNPGASITIVSPSGPVSTVGVFVEFDLAPGTFDPASAEATLNGVPIAVSGGPTNFTGTVNPGFPLEASNVLVVRAARLGSGVYRSKSLAFDYAQPPLLAYRITHPENAITGPLGHSRVGDYILDNGVARFAIQDAPLRDLHSVGQFGGNIIDAELVGRPGLDNFLELQPALNIETVVHADQVDILNDGDDGTAAIVRTCGPDDILDYINASSQSESVGADFPDGADDVDQPVFACNTYTLEPGKTYVRIDTQVFNLSASPVFLFIGDYINGTGELETFTENAEITAGQVGIGEILVNGGFEFFNYYGIGAARGVDYTLASLPNPLNLDPPTNSSSFTTSGVSFVLHGDSIPLVLFGLVFGNPPFRIAGGPFTSNTFTRYFGVGDGSGANGHQLVLDITGAAFGTVSGCVTIEGSGGSVPVPFASVSAGTPGAGPIDTVRSSWTTDADGCYSGQLPVGSYAFGAAKRGFPYLGGGTAPQLTTNVSITSGGNATVDLELPPAGRLHVSSVEELAGGGSAPVPARVTVVGFDPSPEVELTGNLAGAFTVESGLFSDPEKDRIPFGVVRSAYTDSSGSVEFDLEPGSYQVYVSRGIEYSAYDEAVTISSNQTETVNGVLARVLDTPGFVSSDFHIHQINSPDSRIALVDRALQYAGEGIENPVMTDHDALTDLRPTIDTLSLRPWITSTVGEEITTFDTGHFNAYPMLVDTSRAQSFGSTDWGGAAPVGEDFTSLGSFNLTPSEVEAAAIDSVTTAETPDPSIAVQINHIGSHFDPLKIDTSQEPPRSLLTNEEALAFRLPGDPGDPTGLAQNFFHAFGALELWNGFTRGHQSEFLDERIGIWMNLLNQGILSTAIADTDSHTFDTLRASGARSWTASSTDLPEEIDPDEVADSVNAGRVIGGQGLFVTARLLQTNGSGVADLSLGGSTLLSVDNGEVDLEIRVQAPLWAEFDELEIYANADTQVNGTSGGVPTQYTAIPTHSRALAPSPVVVVPSAPGGSRLESALTLRIPDDVPEIPLTQDTWIVIAVRGNDGVSRPMFPIMAASLDSASNTTLADLLDGNLGEGGVMALGYTNALLLDVDGNGVFDPPGVQIAP